MWKSDFHCFGPVEHLEKGQRSGLSHSASCAGQAHGQWFYLLYSLGAILPQKACHFLKLSKILKKQGLHWGISALVPKTRANSHRWTGLVGRGRLIVGGNAMGKKNTEQHSCTAPEKIGSQNSMAGRKFNVFRIRIGLDYKGATKYPLTWKMATKTSWTRQIDWL